MFGSKGVMLGQQDRFKRHRLGELLVRKGKLTQMQLDAALKSQKNSQKPLGEYLCDEGAISRGDLRRTLAEQFAYRVLALSVTAFISFSGFAQPKKVRAETSENVTQISYNYQTARTGRVLTHTQNDEIRSASLQTVPRNFARPERTLPPTDNSLFGSREVKSTNLSAFTKWNNVLSRLDNAGMQKLPARLESYRSATLTAKINVVNNHVNQTPYIEDQKNWGKSDYWATPAEFLTRGGDCEDFAIAKFAMLKSLGVPEKQMRLAIVQDRLKNIPHAVLIVYTENGPVMLDNQVQTVQKVSTFRRYEPIYSINRSAWWRHMNS